MNFTNRRFSKTPDFIKNKTVLKLLNSLDFYFNCNNLEQNTLSHVIYSCFYHFIIIYCDFILLIVFI